MRFLNSLAFTDKKFLSRTQLLMINLVQDVRPKVFVNCIQDAWVATK